MTMDKNFSSLLDHEINNLGDAKDNFKGRISQVFPMKVKEIYSIIHKFLRSIWKTMI
jgi:hypothetical protein